jgi:hypothetical protein
VGQGGQDRVIRPAGSRSPDLGSTVASWGRIRILMSLAATLREQPEPTEHRDTDQVQQSEQHSP